MQLRYQGNCTGMCSVPVEAHRCGIVRYSGLPVLDVKCLLFRDTLCEP